MLVKQINIHIYIYYMEYFNTGFELDFFPLFSFFFFFFFKIFLVASQNAPF